MKLAELRDWKPIVKEKSSEFTGPSLMFHRFQVDNACLPRRAAPAVASNNEKRGIFRLYLHGLIRLLSLVTHMSPSASSKIILTEFPRSNQAPGT
eukprot:1315814-Pleurochrysis_carterae.AAC.2